MNKATDFEHMEHEIVGTVGTPLVDNPKMSTRNVDVYYGDKQAIFGVDLDLAENEVIALIWPSGCGKSTYLRQNALIVVLAQAGAFVPAKSAHIGLVDRLFSRVGAADDLAEHLVAEVGVHHRRAGRLHDLEVGYAAEERVHHSIPAPPVRVLLAVLGGEAGQGGRQEQRQQPGEPAGSATRTTGPEQAGNVAPLTKRATAVPMCKRGRYLK